MDGMFRGISKETGEWVLGWFFQLNNKCFIIKDMAYCEPKLFYFEVHPSSIGMKTGQVDKDDKPIYGSIEIDGKMTKGGDIIKHILTDRPYSSKAKSYEHIYKVVWHSGNKVQDNEHNNNVLSKDPSAFNSEPCFTTVKMEGDNRGRYCNWSHFSGCEIIGTQWESNNVS